MIRKVLIASASALMLVPSLSMRALNAKAYNTNDENESAKHETNGANWKLGLE